MPVFALYNFDDTDLTARDSALGNGAQNGIYLNGAAASGGQAVLDGDNDLVKFYADPSFQMDRGTLGITFTMGSDPLTGTQTLLSRDSAGTTDGGYRVEILANGAVVISHETPTGVETFGTAPGFANPGDTISLSYSWDQGGAEPGRLVLSNATTGGRFVDDVPNSLTMDMSGQGQSQPWIIGAGQSLSDPGVLNNINQHFQGSVTQFQLSDSVDNKTNPPDANPDTSTTALNTAVTFAVLANDTDPDGDTLSILGTPTSPDGTVVVNADGTLTFTPNPGFTGDAVVSYTVVDADGLTDSTTWTITVTPGAASDGIVRGTDGGDLIDASYVDPFDSDRIDANDAIIPGDLPNDDRVEAGAGNDTVLAGLGNDTVNAGTGDDLVYGGAGDDSLNGGAGSDRLFGGDGNDTVNGGDGNDLIDTSGSTPLPDIDYPTLYPADADPQNDRDLVYGGAGNDTILTGDDADTIYGDGGDDLIDAGIDADLVYGGAGADTIIGGEGADTIRGGAGNDLIYGGLNDVVGEALDFPDATDLRPNNNRDNLSGGAGDDTIYGRDDDDTLYGGTGNDLLDGGVDDDLMFGGRGNDTLIGGQGADTMTGGDDRDVFVIGTQGHGIGDVIDGSEGGDDFDTLDLRGAGPLSIVYDAANPENGTVTFFDADRNPTGSMTFTNIENVIPCFTPGTLIATPKGEVAVEHLKAGDRVITRDNGIQEIRWTGQKVLGWKDLAANPHLKPVLIRQGSLGNGLPERDMMVSPNHRMLVANDRTALYFDEHEVLVAAKHLVAGQGIQAIDSIGTTYIHFMFDRHEVVLGNGAWTESFQPGDQTLKGMGNAQRSEIFELFPELKTTDGLNDYQAARRTLRKHEARLLVK